MKCVSNRAKQHDNDLTHLGRQSSQEMKISAQLCCIWDVLMREGELNMGYVTSLL